MTRKDEIFPPFEETPLKLIAMDGDDLNVISALLQDAVFVVKDMTYSETRREMALLLNRFRWELVSDHDADGQRPERVRTVLLIRDIMTLESNLPSRAVTATPFSILTIEFTPTGDGSGFLHIKLAGHWDIKAGIECINLSLTDVSVPYDAPSGRIPGHRSRT